MPRVTKSLRDQWNWQILQMREERTHTQAGTERSPEDIKIVDFDISVLERLLSLPLGTKFDARDIQREMLDDLAGEQS